MGTFKHPPPPCRRTDTPRCQEGGLAAAGPSAPPQVITSNELLRQHYQSLTADHIVTGRIRIRPGEEYLLLDLLSRNIRCIPSVLSQQLSRSKAAQTLILGQYMVPGTTVVHSYHDLPPLFRQFADKGSIITKTAHQHAGMGVHRWSCFEDLYTHCGHGSATYPLIIQPYIANCVDVRVLLIGSYVEAYQRYNPYSFRHNLHFGGEAKPFPLPEEMETFCRRVMKRGDFPYAHLDLLLDPKGTYYLSEISLRGGLRGARISHDDYLRRINERQQQLLQAMLSQQADC